MVWIGAVQVRDQAGSAQGLETVWTKSAQDSDRPGTGVTKPGRQFPNGNASADRQVGLAASPCRRSSSLGAILTVNATPLACQMHSRNRDERDTTGAPS